MLLYRPPTTRPHRSRLNCTPLAFTHLNCRHILYSSAIVTRLSPYAKDDSCPSWMQFERTAMLQLAHRRCLVLSTLGGAKAEERTLLVHACLLKGPARTAPSTRPVSRECEPSRMQSTVLAAHAHRNTHIRVSYRKSPLFQSEAFNGGWWTACAKWARVREECGATQTTLLLLTSRVRFGIKIRPRSRASSAMPTSSLTVRYPLTTKRDPEFKPPPLSTLLPRAAAAAAIRGATLSSKNKFIK